MGRPVADPGGVAAVEMDGGPVLGVHLGAAVRSCPGSHDRCIHRDEQVPPGARGQPVGELDTHGPVLLGDDQRPQIMRRADRDAADFLNIAAEFGTRRRQVRVQPLAELDEPDFVIIRARIGRRIRRGDGDILSEVIRSRRPKAGQRIHELAQAAGDGGDVPSHVARDHRKRAVGIVRIEAIVIRRSAGRRDHANGRLARRSRVPCRLDPGSGRLHLGEGRALHCVRGGLAIGRLGPRARRRTHARGRLR